MTHKRNNKNKKKKDDTDEAYARVNETVNQLEQALKEDPNDTDAMVNIIKNMMPGLNVNEEKQAKTAKNVAKNMKRKIKRLKKMTPSLPWPEAIRLLPEKKHNLGVKNWLKAAELIQRNKEIVGTNSENSLPNNMMQNMLRGMSAKINKISKDDTAIEWAMNLIEIYAITGGNGIKINSYQSPYICKLDYLNILDHNSTANPAANRKKITQREHVICLATLICEFVGTPWNDNNPSHYQNCVFIATELTERLIVHFKPDAMSNPDLQLLTIMNPNIFISCHYRVGFHINRKVSRMVNKAGNREQYFVHQKEMLRYAKNGVDNYPTLPWVWYYKGLALSHNGRNPDFKGALENFEMAKKLAVEGEDDIIAALSSIDIANVLLMGAKGKVLEINEVQALKNDFDMYAGKCESWNNGNVCVGWPLDPGNLVATWLSPKGNATKRPIFPSIPGLWNNDYSAMDSTMSKKSAAENIAYNKRAMNSFVKPNKILYCSNCGKEEKKSSTKGKNFKRCARCRKVIYCSRACQKEHWKKGGHKDVCKK